MFGHHVRITSNSKYIFTIENECNSTSAADDRPNIIVYKKANNSSYTLHKTFKPQIWTDQSNNLVANTKSTTSNTKIDISSDGSILLVTQIYPVEGTKVYLHLYYNSFNQANSNWEREDVAVKNFGVDMNGFLERGDSFMSPNGKYVAIPASNAFLSGGSSGDGTVTVFEICNNSIGGLSIEERVEFTCGSGDSYQFGDLGWCSISNNLFVLARSESGPPPTISHAPGHIWLYKIVPTIGSTTWSAQKITDLKSPNTSVTSFPAGTDKFGTSPTITEKYFAFTAPGEDNPDGNANNNLGALYVYKYNEDASDGAIELIKDSSSNKNYSFFGIPPTIALGQESITIKVFTADNGVDTDMYIFISNGGRYLSERFVVWYFDLTKQDSNWQQIAVPEIPLDPYSNTPLDVKFWGYSRAVSDDTVVVSAPGFPLGSPGSNQKDYIQIYNMNLGNTRPHVLITSSSGNPVSLRKLERTVATVKSHIPVSTNAVDYVDIGYKRFYSIYAINESFVKYTDEQRLSEYQIIEKLDWRLVDHDGTIRYNLPQQADDTVHTVIFNSIDSADYIKKWDGDAYIFENSGDFEITFNCDPAIDTSNPGTVTYGAAATTSTVASSALSVASPSTIYSVYVYLCRNDNIIFYSNWVGTPDFTQGGLSQPQIGLPLKTNISFSTVESYSKDDSLKIKIRVSLMIKSPTNLNLPYDGDHGLQSTFIPPRTIISQLGTRLTIKQLI
jgi:hypothetical protein